MFEFAQITLNPLRDPCADFCVPDWLGLFREELGYSELAEL